MAERRGRFWECSGGWWGRTRRREDGGGWELLHSNTLPLLRFQYQFFLHFKIFYPILNLYLTHEYLVYKNALFIPLCSDGPLLAQFRFTCSPCLAEWCCSHVVQFTSVVRELGKWGQCVFHLRHCLNVVTALYCGWHSTEYNLHVFARMELRDRKEDSRLGGGWLDITKTVLYMSPWAVSTATEGDRLWCIPRKHLKLAQVWGVGRLEKSI